MSLNIVIDGKTVDVTALSTSQLVETYNTLAQRLGEREVNRFATRAKAESRLVGIADRAARLSSPAIRLTEADQQQIKTEAKDRQEATQEHRNEAVIPLSPSPAGEGTPRWARPKYEAPSKIAYRPRPGSSQMMMYDLLANTPRGIDIENFCEAMKANGIKDKTLHQPSTVWSCLRYLFVTGKGYGLEFDGTRIRLIVPSDERDAVRGKRD